MPHINDKLSAVPKIKLANLPTPLEEATRLASKTGLTQLLIKRDDLTGLALGGNKARKLEYDFAEILDDGYDVVLTAGGIQSNHARMTAAAARKFGLDVKLVLGGPDFDLLKGNLLLDNIFNAEIRYLVEDDANDQLTKAMEKWSDELTKQGRRPYILPIGGSTGLGALGYVEAIKELQEQYGNDNAQIVLGVGSCGTFAGALLGAKIYMPNARLIGISVSRTVEAIRACTKNILLDCAKLLEYDIDINNTVIECYDNYHVEYGIMTEGGRKAIYDCSNLEGILLDPVYTGKVMHGLIDLAAKRIINPEVPVVFFHTGGTPIIFSFEEEFSKEAQISKIYKP